MGAESCSNELDQQTKDMEVYVSEEKKRVETQREQALKLMESQHLDEAGKQSLTAVLAQLDAIESRLDANTNAAMQRIQERKRALDRLQPSAGVLVPPSVFVYILALLDSFVAEALRYDFSHDTKQILESKGENPVTYSAVFGARSRTELVGLIIDHEVRKITGLSVEKQIKHLKKRKINLSSVDVPKLREIVATRNVYVHNGGKVGRDYLTTARDCKLGCRYRLGDARPLDDAYIASAADMACCIIRAVRDHIAGTP